MDELVRSLRICAEGEHCDKCTKWEAKQNGGLNVCQTAICKEAADAIEKLEKQLYAEKEACDAYYYAYQHWMHQYIKDIENRVDAKPVDGDKFVDAIIKSYEQPRWIPVTERLPEAGERVLCYCRANIYEVMKMRTDGDWVYDTNHVYMRSFVTHWMPLPEPPKAEEGE